ncbi:unnamed protein product [Rotaria sordida]|uniref:3-hydroxyisobutyryl-CoA hydrolase, mitochondrial n=1 Tax=Rotaria sordida TaxID=392033 RepID=A0A818SWL1_9BILA|nr:unnamed protein product [Rotaria sordida]
MPETTIGLFPNAGDSYFLLRLSNNLGVFLGLTGHRLRSMDVVHAESDGSLFALKQLSILKKMSPISLKITLVLLKRGKQFDLKECLKMEYRILHYAINDHDFFEDVRAFLIDKDNKLQWKPNLLEILSDEHIAHYFEKLSHDKELHLSEKNN